MVAQLRFCSQVWLGTHVSETILWIWAHVVYLGVTLLRKRRCMNLVGDREWLNYFILTSKEWAPIIHGLNNTRRCMTSSLSHFSRHVGFTVDLGCILLHLKAVQFLFIFLLTPLCATSCLLFLLIHRIYKAIKYILRISVEIIFTVFFIAITNGIHSTTEFSNVPLPGI